MTKYMLDTNTLFWYFVENSRNHKKVKKFLNPLILTKDSTFIVNEIIMLELFHILVKKRGKKGIKIAMDLLENEASPIKIHFDCLKHSDLREVLTHLTRYGMETTIGGRDSTIIKSCVNHKIDYLITNDKGFKQVKEINLLNPLK